VPWWTFCVLPPLGIVEHGHRCPVPGRRADLRNVVRKQEQDTPETSRPRTPSPAAAGPPQRHPGAPLTQEDVLHLQRLIGNAAVARLLGAGRRDDAPAGGNGPAARGSTVPGVLRSPGHPLDAGTRTDMEARLDADFADVRLHTDTAARRSAAEIGARAYTSGHHVVLGEGGTDEHTLAHELTHVLQQRRGPVTGTDAGGGLTISDPGDQFERDAEATANRALAHEPPSRARTAGDVPASPSSSAPVQRAPAEGHKRGLSESTTEQGTNPKRPALAGGGATTSVEDVNSPEARARAAQENRSAWEFIEALKAKFAAAKGKWEVCKGEKGSEYAQTRVQGTPTPGEFPKTPEVVALEALSAAVFAYLGVAREEVQSAIDSSGRLVMATNISYNNEELEKGLRGEDTTKTEPLQKIVKRVVEEHPALHAAFGKGVAVASNGSGEMHAEMRILERDHGVTPPHLAGTRRPCSVCFVRLYPQGADEKAVRPGVVYLTRPALAGSVQYQQRFDREAEKAAELFTVIDTLVGKTHQAKGAADRKVYGGRVTPPPPRDRPETRPGQGEDSRRAG
jgi:hypothetical protein